jgi:hypothetical protein
MRDMKSPRHPLFRSRGGPLLLLAFALLLTAAGCNPKKPGDPPLEPDPVPKASRT